MFSQLLLKAEADLGEKPECYYWDENPYGDTVCVEYDEKGVCKKSTMADGSPVPSNYGGNMAECKLLLNSILSNTEIVAKCEGNAYAKGCIPEYEGYDTVKQANDPDMTDDEAYIKSAGCPNFRKNAILNNRYAYVFKNGIIWIPYGLSSLPIYAVDINGKKGPNKWGHDLFTFTVKSNNSKPLKLYGDGCMIPEKGGITTTKMMENIYSRK